VKHRRETSLATPKPGSAQGSGAAVLQLSASAPGTVTVTGKGVKRVRSLFALAGSISLAMSFRPAGGGVGSASTKIVTFK
jgi:hypothetical protein